MVYFLKSRFLSVVKTSTRTYLNQFGCLDSLQVPRSVLLDLQRHILRTEAALERKKEENAALRLHIQHYEKKWNQYESKMKAMEKMWQDQLTSVQVSILCLHVKANVVQFLISEFLSSYDILYGDHLMNCQRYIF